MRKAHHPFMSAQRKKKINWDRVTIKQATWGPDLKGRSKGMQQSLATNTIQVDRATVLAALRTTKGSSITIPKHVGVGWTGLLSKSSKTKTREVIIGASNSSVVPQSYLSQDNPCFDGMFVFCCLCFDMSRLWVVCVSFALSFVCYLLNSEMLFIDDCVAVGK